MILIDIGWFSFIRGCQIGHLRFSTLCKFMEVTSGFFFWCGNLFQVVNLRT